MVKNISILFATGIFPPDIGGPASYVPKISERFLKEGIVPIVICYSNVNEHVSDKNGYSVIRIKRSKLFLRHYIKYFFAILKYGKAADVIYLQNYFSAGLPTIIANLFLKKKMILKIVGIFSWEQLRNFGFTKDILDDYIIKNRNIIFKVIKLIERKIINKVDKIITPSNYMKNLLIKFGINTPISIVYNSFDPFLYKKINKDIFKKKLGVNKNEKVYLYVGRLVNWKNLNILINSFTERKNDKLFIVGDGPEMSLLKNLIKDTGQTDNIKLVGSKSKSEVYNYYQIADIFVLISSYEGMSHVLLEAIYMNLNIISSKIKPNIETLNGYNKSNFISLTKDCINLSVNNKGNIISNKNILQKYDFESLYFKLKEELGI